ncbi:putative sugar O-methyltransferase [bacterium]|nr:putative sugar O-methyltransferase [bacterium]
MNKKIVFFSSIIILGNLFAKSVTAERTQYEKETIRIVQDEKAFAKFRSLPGIVDAYEHVSPALGVKFLESIKVNYPEVFAQIDQFQTVDSVGSPAVHNYKGVGAFAGTTLRFIHIAAEITKMFDLPSNCKIVEVGCGYGGQCLVLSAFTNFSSYTMIDLPNVTPVIEKFLGKFELANTRTLVCTDCTLTEEYDLFISNYAVSECSKKEQDEYIKNVIAFAKRGYMIYNHCDRAYKVADFVSKLQEVGIEAKVVEETVQTFPYKKNVLIYWGAN